MDRRSLLKLLPVAIAGTALGSAASRTAATTKVVDASEGNVIGGHSYTRAHREALRKVTRKIIKESADMWGSVRDRSNGRNAVLVTLYGNLARKITFDSGYIIEKEITLDEKQRADLRQYQDGLNRRIPQRIGTEFLNGSWRLRAWIYNGRRPNEWIMSAEKIAA